MTATAIEATATAINSEAPPVDLNEVMRQARDNSAALDALDAAKPKAKQQPPAVVNFEKRESIVAKLSKALRLHDRWSNESDDDSPPPRSFFDAAVALVHEASEPPHPAELMGLLGAIEKFSTQLAGHLSLLDCMERQPRELLWITFSDVQRAYELTSRDDRLPDLESIALLDTQGVSHEQIARIYGLTDSAGFGQAFKIVEELAKPGCWTGPDTGWVHPEAIARKAAELEKVRNWSNLSVLAANDTKLQMIKSLGYGSESAADEADED